jgi:uncharacterized membrane protein YjjB (DUF3815 family)
MKNLLGLFFAILEVVGIILVMETKNSKYYLITLVGIIGLLILFLT